MALESATYISDLVATNPPGADPMAQGDNHIRLLKSTIKATFPNVVGTTPVATADLTALPALRTSFATLQTDAVSKSVDNAATASLVITGTGKVLDAPSIKQGGNVLIPRGVVVMWSGSTSAVPGGWALCDGTNGTPNLLDRFVLGAGFSYAAFATGGSATLSGTAASAGAHTHGGTALAGSHTHTGTTDAAGSHSHGGGTQSYALTVTDLPPHSHGENVSATSGASPGIIGAINLGSSGPVALTTDPTGGGAAHAHGISSDGVHAHNIFASTAADHLHAISSDGAHTHTVSSTGLPPYVALGYIMKL